jgi:hypothetical protein
MGDREVSRCRFVCGVNSCRCAVGRDHCSMSAKPLRSPLSQARPPAHRRSAFQIALELTTLSRERRLMRRPSLVDELADARPLPLRVDVASDPLGQRVAGLRQPLEHHGKVGVRDAPRAEERPGIGWNDLLGRRQ